MAYWSHSLAKKPHNPGYVEWNHFRSEAEQFLNNEDKAKWAIKNSKYLIGNEKVIVQ